MVVTANGGHTINDEMAEVEVKGNHRVPVRTKAGEVEEAVVELRYQTIGVLPPIAKPGTVSNFVCGRAQWVIPTCVNPYSI